MFNIEKYISSGIIESYCLNATTPEEKAELERNCKEYPEVRQELAAAQAGLIAYASQFEQEAPPGVAAKILDRIEELKLETASLSQPALRASEFIGISARSDLEKWQKLTACLAPPAHFGDIHSHELFDDGQRQLVVMWVKEEVPEEAHDDLNEKVFVLEGSCTCTVGGKEIDLSPGGFLEVPLYTDHSLRVTSEQPLKLIVTRVKLKEAA